MSAKIHGRQHSRQRRLARQLKRRRRRLARRLEHRLPDDCSRPVLRAGNIHYELSGRAQATTCGGIGVIQQLVNELHLAQAIDQRLGILKAHLPYHESDHVLNLAYNALCGGTCLEDLELRRSDEAFLDALGAQRLPDPTTAGDFCRRFNWLHIDLLQEAYHVARKKVWARQPAGFFQQATIDMDGTLVPTQAECKQGIGLSYKGIWGYHPLLISLAETGEVLWIMNRSANRPSHEGAAHYVDRTIALCTEAGFQWILLRGDTDFSQTVHLDRWNANPRVTFLFGLDDIPQRELAAEDLPQSAWKPLVRPSRYTVKTEPRERPERVKQQIVEERGYRDLRLEQEWVAEVPYRPVACQTTYRMIVLRKDLLVRDPKQPQLFHTYRYFYFITNDRTRTPAELVLQANQRCNQENLHAQLKGGLRALSAPVDNLLSNWAWMVMVGLAWNLKAWLALWLPEQPGRWLKQQRAAKQRLLRMEFRTFVKGLMHVPCQIIRSGRRLIYRLLAWNPWVDVLFRLTELFRPQRC